MSTKENDSHTNQQEKVLSITRVFDAPRPLVFEAWTKPEHLKQWFAPPNFTIPSLEAESRPSGAWRSTMQTPNGELLTMGGIYQEVVPNERLVFTHAWDDGTGKPGHEGHETVITVTFADQDAKTVMHFHQAIFDSKESRDAHNEGWTQFFDHLAEYLAQEQN